MRRIFSTALLAIVVAVPALAQDQSKPCALIGKAFLDMDVDSYGRITVPVTINGVTKRMLVDTGAFETMITADTAQELGLKPRDAHGIYTMGFGGRADVGVVTVADFRIGRMKGADFKFFVDRGRIRSSSGLLGMDFLQTFDLDFDFAKAKLSLVAPDHCPNLPPYWTRQSFGVIPYKLIGNHIWIDVRLDGQKIRAVLDTGASDTVMSLERASSAFDLDVAELAKSRHYPFKSLSFGDVEVKRPVIDLIKDKESVVLGRWSDSLQMIVGMGVLRNLHLYFNSKEKLIYVTPATQY